MSSHRLCREPAQLPCMHPQRPSLRHRTAHVVNQGLRTAAGAVMLALAACSAAAASDIGWRSMTVPATPDRAAIPVALWYPAQPGAPVRAVPMGPFRVNAAIGAPAADRLRGLILISHGTGGTELGHGRLAEALAARGYLVAALRHPGDNWQDESLRNRSVARYFDERPRQVSRVLDTLLADPAWSPRLARDAIGPRVGAVGHSAGGYTVLALAGGRPDPLRITTHCRDQAAADPIFCDVARSARAGSANEPSSGNAGPMGTPALADPRVRAVAALSPLGVVFDADSLRSLRTPVMMWAAEQDRYLVPRFHAGWIAQNLPGASLRSVPHAWHFAFMDTPASPIPSPDGDLRADPPGFDRARFLDELGQALGDFFERAM